MATTITNVITSVKENLGNRSSGVIGGTPVTTVILRAFNLAFKESRLQIVIHTI